MIHVLCGIVLESLPGGTCWCIDASGGWDLNWALCTDDADAQAASAGSDSEPSDQVEGQHGMAP